MRQASPDPAIASAIPRQPARRRRITNDRLPSTTHRVGKPVDGSHILAPRVSFATNVYLWEDELLEVLPGLGEPKYPPVKAITFHTRSTSKFYGDDYAVDSD